MCVYVCICTHAHMHMLLSGSKIMKTNVFAPLVFIGELLSICSEHPFWEEYRGPFVMFSFLGLAWE